MNLVMGLVAAGWLVVVSHEENEHPSVGHLLHIRISQDFQAKEGWLLSLDIGR